VSRTLWTRILLVALAWSALVVGAWATFAPRSFYDSFPGGGRSWVAPDGPYNHHLVTDVGELNLALLVVTLTATVTLQRLLVRTTAVAWLVYGIPHLVYHASHREPFETGDVIASLTSLSFAVALPLVLLALTWGQDDGATRDANASTLPAGSRKNAIHSSTPSSSNVPS
jgi:hypothetical protein